MSVRTETALRQPFSLLGGISLLMVLNGLVQLPDMLENLLSVWETATAPVRALLSPIAELVHEVFQFDLPAWWIDYVVVGSVSAAATLRVALSNSAFLYQLVNRSSGFGYSSIDRASYVGRVSIDVGLSLLFWPIVTLKNAYLLFRRWRRSQVKSQMAHVDAYAVRTIAIFFESFLYAAIIAVAFWLPGAIMALDWPTRFAGG